MSTLTQFPNPLRSHRFLNSSRSSLPARQSMLRPPTRIVSRETAKQSTNAEGCSDGKTVSKFLARHQKWIRPVMILATCASFSYHPKRRTSSRTCEGQSTLCGKKIRTLNMQVEPWRCIIYLIPSPPNFFLLQFLSRLQLSNSVLWMCLQLCCGPVWDLWLVRLLMAEQAGTGIFKP